MATYCNIGDIARVTFPGGSIQDFSDTPIEVFVNTMYGSTGMVDVWLDTGMGGWGFYPPVLGVFYKTGGNYTHINGNRGYDFYVLCKGRYGYVYFNGDYGYAPLGYVAWGHSPSRFSVSQNGQPSPKTYQIIIKGNNGNELLKQTYSTNNYTVDCIQGCPPNTLDCGDCCLDCNSIFNSISDIRRLIATIR